MLVLVNHYYYYYSKKCFPLFSWKCFKILHKTKTTNLFPQTPLSSVSFERELFIQMNDSIGTVKWGSCAQADTFWLHLQWIFFLSFLFFLSALKNWLINYQTTFWHWKICQFYCFCYNFDYVNNSIEKILLLLFNATIFLTM